jgi:DNA primase
MLKERASIAGYAGKLVQWDKRKSVPTRGDYWAPCPFHSEKTASFHVRDNQANYHCFGCNESGGILDLAMKLEGLSFPEAVERVAAYAGIALPEDDTPRDEGEELRRKRLFAASARAQELFREALSSAAGGKARRYLEGRGLDPAVCEQFGIGYAPPGWTDTLDRLKKASFTEEELITAGLASKGDERRAIDVFRDRIMFPIGDAQGRIIAFGGRALDPEAKAKYLNSPETPLFHKGSTLYRLKEARALLARTKAKGLVVAEGYIDVIALERAGIAAVAPLGTALTEDQLALVWRAGGEPIFCFDGDGAGKRAASRALDLALPQIGPGRTLSIALLPEGQDPDDVYRKAGPGALAPLLEAALPAATALFERERDREPLDTPERKSGLKKRLREAAGRVADEETRRLYLSDLLARTDDLFRRPARQWQDRPPPRRDRPPGGYPGSQAPGGKQGRFTRYEPEARPTPELKAYTAAGPRHLASENFLREAVDQPRILEKFADWVVRLPLSDPDLALIRDTMLDLAEREADRTVDREGLKRHLKASGHERAFARVAAWPVAPVRTDLGTDDVRANGEAREAEWMALVTLDVVLPALKEEMAALASAANQGDSGAFERFLALDRDARRIEDEVRAQRSGHQAA